MTRAKVSDGRSGPPVVLGRAPRRWQVSPSWVAVLVAAILVAVVAAALASHNADFYTLWIYSDPQTSDEQYEQVMVDLFMAHTSGFFWGQFLALLLGAFLAAHLPAMSRALAVAVPAGVLLAAVDFAVAWQMSADIRRRLGWWAERRSPAVPTDLLADDRFQQVLGAGLVAFPIAAIAGVGLGTLIRPLRRAPAVAVTVLAVIATVSYGGIAATLGLLAATADDAPGAVLAALALVPPSAVTPSVVRTAVGDHGAAFTSTMLISSAAWALLLTSGGLLVQRRTRSPRRAARP